MFNVLGQRCNKEQNPVCLLPFDQEASTSQLCPNLTPLDAALLPLGQADREDQWYFLLGKQMVQRIWAGMSWQGTVKEVEWCLCRKMEQKKPNSEGLT